MPFVNFYMSKKVEFPAADMDVLKSKAHRKTLTVQLQSRDIANGEVKSSFNIKKEILDWMKGFKMSQSGYMMFKNDAKLDGKVKKLGLYELNIGANQKRFKATLIMEPARGVVVEPPVAPEATYANSKVKSACSGRDFQAKIESISLAGPKETGHGPVPYLDNALHAHVTNTHSVAWKWRGDKMHIVATGKKNNENKTQAPPGKSKKLKTRQYDWDMG